MHKKKPRFTLAICLIHLSIFQVYYNILILPAGIFPHGIFFCGGGGGGGGIFFPWEFFILSIYPVRN